jgi:lysophospholipase L1-like esterase
VTDVLSQLRSQPGLPARVGSRLFSGVRTVESTRRPFADWWEAANRGALAAEGPLWLVLGDSTSQGIGASAPQAGYVPRVKERLDELTGDRWRVINLSITGAKMMDVVDRELPAATALGLDAELITSFVGANDVLYPWGVAEGRSSAARLVAALPPGTIQSEMGGGPSSRPKATAINKVLQAAVTDNRLSLFNPWNWPSMRGAWAEDRFHPNDVGYGHLTEAVWQAVEPAIRPRADPDA